MAPCNEGRRAASQTFLQVSVALEQGSVPYIADNIFGKLVLPYE